MNARESVRDWIARLKAGEEEAAQKVWNRYYERLIVFARKKLAATPRRVADEEDAVLSAFNSFFKAVQTGRFPRLEDQDDLWQSLVVVTERKAINQAHHLRRAKRGRGRVRGDSAFDDGQSSDYVTGFDRVPGQQPSPEFAIMVAEQWQHMFAALGDRRLREIAVLKMEGFTNQEISEKSNCTRRTVARKLRLIKKKLEKQLAAE